MGASTTRSTAARPTRVPQSPKLHLAKKPDLFLLLPHVCAMMLCLLRSALVLMSSVWHASFSSPPTLTLRLEHAPCTIMCEITCELSVADGDVNIRNCSMYYCCQLPHLCYIPLLPVAT